MKHLIIGLLAAVTLPTYVNAEKLYNKESICTMTSEYNSNYKIEITWSYSKSLGVLYYKDNPKFSLTFDSSQGYGSPFFLVEKFSEFTNPYYKYYYTGQKKYGSDETHTGQDYRSGSRVSFVGNLPLSEYLERSEKEQKRVKGKGRSLLIDLAQAFHYLPDTQKERADFYEIRNGEWFRVAKNFWEKDKRCSLFL